MPVLHQLAHRRVEFVHENMQEYFRDVYDHLLRTVDKVNQFSDMLSSVLAANLTALDRRRDVFIRYMRAYRDGLDWLYSDPAALTAYAAQGVAA